MRSIVSRSHTVAARGRLNLIATIGSAAAIAVLLNILFSGARVRTDLTEHGINALSGASRDAVAGLEGLEVRVYVSPDLPSSIPAAGRDLKLQGLAQRLDDKLAEYAADAPDMTLTRVTEDLIGEAERNRLRIFSGSGGTISDEGRFEFPKYALGLSFHYKNQTEAFELAIQPEHYEFEITRRLIRLKDKAEFAIILKDMLDAAHAVADSVRRCTAALKGANDDAADSLGLEADDEISNKFKALMADAPGIRAGCDGLSGTIEAAKAVKSDVEAFGRLVTSAEALANESKALTDAVEAPEPPAAWSLVAERQRLVVYGERIDRAVQAIEDAPGQQRIGFVCHAKSFCPFPDTRPLIPREVSESADAQAGALARILAYLVELEREVAETLREINRGLFRGRGFEIVRVDLDAPLPEDLKALVVYGPSADFTAWQLWQLDQFVLRGGSLVAFLNPWDVLLQPIGRTAPPEKARMNRLTSNFEGFLAHYGLAPTGGLVVETEQYGEVTLTQFRLQGSEVVPVQNVTVPYPMLPTFSDMAVEDPLVRATPTLTLPFTTSFQLQPQAGAEAIALVRSSTKAASADRADFPLDPGKQLETASAEARGVAMPVIVMARGELTSFFKGKAEPTRPAAPKEAETGGAEVGPQSGPSLESGRGRILAIGSTLGLTSLDRDVIFAGFAADELSRQDGAVIAKVEGFRANFETWSRHLDEVRATLPGNIQFLQNALDWSVQREDVAELRSKQYAERPLDLTSPGDRLLYRGLALAISPALLLVFGAWWSFRRRGRKRRLAA